MYQLHNETVQFPFNAVETAGSGVMLENAQKANTGIIIIKPLAGGAIKSAGLSLRFILEFPVTTVIPGMDSIEQVEANAMDGINYEPLKPEEKSSLRKRPPCLEQISAGGVSVASPVHRA